MSRNNQGGVLADVTRGLLGSLLDDKATKASKIYGFTMCETVLHNGHELFDNGNNCGLVDAGCLCDFTRYFCLSHCTALNLIRFYIAKLRKPLNFGTNYLHNEGVAELPQKSKQKPQLSQVEAFLCP